MFPYADPQTRLDLHHQRIAEMIRDADEYRLTHASGRRSGRWRRRGRRERSRRLASAA
jgi:hypothetical protein